MKPVLGMIFHKNGGGRNKQDIGSQCDLETVRHGRAVHCADDRNRTCTHRAFSYRSEIGDLAVRLTPPAQAADKKINRKSMLTN
jgi:hypothetical protein